MFCQAFHILIWSELPGGVVYPLYLPNSTHPNYFGDPLRFKVVIETSPQTVNALPSDVDVFIFSLFLFIIKESRVFKRAVRHVIPISRWRSTSCLSAVSICLDETCENMAGNSSKYSTCGKLSLSVKTWQPFLDVIQQQQVCYSL